MNLLAFLLVGLVVGWIASVFVYGHGRGAVQDIVVGILGAVIGGYLFDVFGIVAFGFWGAFGMSIVGSVVVLVIIGMFSGGRSERDLLHR